jgi:hypothetical protein
MKLEFFFLDWKKTRNLFFKKKKMEKKKNFFKNLKNRKKLEKQKENKNSLCLIFFLSSFLKKIPFPSFLFFSFLFFDFLTIFFCFTLKPKQKKTRKRV